VPARAANKGMLTLDALMGSLKDELQYADVKKQLTELQKVSCPFPTSPQPPSLSCANAFSMR
jgi:hypothetical protein